MAYKRKRKLLKWFFSFFIFSKNVGFNFPVDFVKPPAKFKNNFNTFSFFFFCTFKLIIIKYFLLIFHFYCFFSENVLKPLRLNCGIKIMIYIFISFGIYESRIFCSGCSLEITTLLLRIIFDKASFCN